MTAVSDSPDIVSDIIKCYVCILLLKAPLVMAVHLNQCNTISCQLPQSLGVPLQHIIQATLKVSKNTINLLLPGSENSLLCFYCVQSSKSLVIFTLLMGNIQTPLCSVMAPGITFLIVCRNARILSMEMIFFTEVIGKTSFKEINCN